MNPHIPGVRPAPSGPHAQDMTDLERNKTIVHDYIDALFTRGDLSAVDRYLAEDLVNHDPPLRLGSGREGLRAAAAAIRAGCPDWHSDQHRLIAEGDYVVEHFTASGTHTAELFGAAPTGDTVTLQGIQIFRVVDGVIVERWGRLDELGMLGQLGLVRSADTAPASA
jgi:predicted ester cyclase